STEDQLVAQKQLFELQQRVEAWSIIVPFLQHEDPILQFWGAHTAQVKISRDWETLPEEDVDAFRQSLVGLIGHSAGRGGEKVVLRKLYVALISVALRLTASTPPRWLDWVVSSITDLSAAGLSHEQILDYSIIVAEETSRSDLNGQAKAHLSTAVRSAVVLVTQAITTSLNNPASSVREQTTSLKCVEAWIPHLPGDQLTELAPIIVNTLSRPDLFVGATDVICELMTSSPLSSGSGTKILTDPLLQWLEVEGREIYQASVETESIDEVGRGLCKMLAAIGDHSLDYVMQKLNDPRVLAFLEIMLGFTGFPGWFGVDEFESEMTTTFWVFFSEHVLDSDWFGDDTNPSRNRARDILVSLIKVLHQKTRWPAPEELKGWTKGQCYDRPQLTLSVTTIMAQRSMWGFLFTHLAQLGDFSTWFAERPTPILLSGVTFVVAGLRDPQLAIFAAGALEQLCDANRTQLAPHIASFGEVLAETRVIPTAERAKVIQSVASVIEALPPSEGLTPVLAIVRPITEEWRTALQAAPQYPEEARTQVEQRIRLLSACAKGISPSQDAFSYDDPDSPEGMARLQAMEIARMTPPLIETCEMMVSLLRETMVLWSADGELADAISDFVKFITSLPHEATLISLPPAPILELVCAAASRQLTGVWLNLVSRLVVQLHPASFVSLKAEAAGETKLLVDQATQSIIVSSVQTLTSPGVMEANPDLVQAFFSCMDSIAHTFLRSMTVMPPELSNALMDCTTRAIALQERYSLVSACKFLVTFIKRSASDDTAHEAAQQLLAAHAQNLTNAVVNGIAGDAPRSVVPNLASVLSVMVTKLPNESRVWLTNSMQNPILLANPRATSEAKDAFLKTISASRLSSRTATAANDFALVARGLIGTSYAAGQVL
ncbi:hypothetical protein DL93DRAFT_2065964, partial [Clavulina sp. PMI_390]